MAFAIFDGLFGSDDPVSPLSNPDAGTGTAVLERPEEETKLDDGGNGDADRFAHYVSRDRIAESKMTGRPVVALCGKVWVPKRDPTHYPVCPDCKRIYGRDDEQLVLIAVRPCCRFMPPVAVAERGD